MAEGNWKSSKAAMRYLPRVTAAVAEDMTHGNLQRKLGQAVNQ
jgi:hypothetical protein